MAVSTVVDSPGQSTNQENSMTASTPPSAPAADNPALDKTEVERPKKVGLTVGRMRAISAKTASGRERYAEALELVAELMIGRENRESEKVNAVRSIGSRIVRLSAEMDEVDSALSDLIELALDDD